MAFNRVGISKSAQNASFQQQFIAAANYEPERSMSNSRLVGSILSVFIGICVIYASIFYAPAFFNISQILGFSTENAKLPAIDSEKDGTSGLSAYANIFKIRRGFIRRGQALKVDYSLSPGTTMTVEIRRCNAPVFVEVVYCNHTEGQKIKMDNIGPGAKSMIMRNPGFYYFDEVVTNHDGSPTTKPYRVVWSRKSLASK